MTPKDEEIVCHQETSLKKSHDLTASLLQLQTVIHSLRVKTHIATSVPLLRILYLYMITVIQEYQTKIMGFTKYHHITTRVMLTDMTVAFVVAVLAQ